jgi:hypothetical protein
MTALPIAFRTNTSKYSFLGSTELLNCYAEQQGADAKAPLAVLPCYGMKLFAEVTDTPCRGLIYLDDLDVIYAIHSTIVYKVESDGTATSIGIVAGNDIVQLSRNQADPVQISIHCDAGEYYIENDIIKNVTDTDLPSNVISQDHAGGYTAYGLDDRRFFLSSINECQTIDGTDFATAEQSADPLVRVKADRGDLFLMKKRSIEPWRNTGQADFPFEPIGGATLQKGLLAANAVANCDNTLMWPGDDSIVYRLNGYQAVRISTHGIERTIEADTDPSSILGFSHANEGHSFFTLTGADWSRSYDAATQAWHTRQSYGLGHWRARFPVRAWGKTIVGDVLTGNLYELDKDTFKEGDDPLIWGIDSPTVHAFPNGGIVDALFLDVATGVGLGSGQGSDPKLMLSWSTDGGNTYKGHRQLSLGARGDRVRVVTRRLGRFGQQGIKFRIRISDPVIRALVNVDIAVRPLKR